MPDPIPVEVVQVEQPKPLGPFSTRYAVLRRYFHEGNQYELFDRMYVGATDAAQLAHCEQIAARAVANGERAVIIRIPLEQANA